MDNLPSSWHTENNDSVLFSLPVQRKERKEKTPFSEEFLAA
jgi:hypothetical protein